MANALTEALETEVKTQTVVIDEEKDYLAEFVGPGKKYDDPKKLAKSYAHANLHIQELTEELEEARNKAEEDKKLLSELVAGLKNPSQPRNDDPPSNQEEAGNPGAVNEDIVLKAVDKALFDREKKKSAQENTDTALTMLTTFYGSKEEALKSVAKVVNNDPLMKKMVNELAAHNPNAAYKLITGEQPKPQEHINTPGAGVVVSAGANTKPTPHQMTWSSCRKLKKEKPLEYNSVAFRAKITEAATAYAAAGMDFYKT